MKDCFNTLDEDGGESIGQEEMEKPMIGLGFAETPYEVAKMIRAVDADGSGMIEFDEFLDIIKGSGSSENKISIFFKDMVKGKIGDPNLNFDIMVNDIRRRDMLNSLLEERKANNALIWCRNNNFPANHFDSKASLAPN